MRGMLTALILAALSCAGVSHALAQTTAKGAKGAKAATAKSEAAAWPAAPNRP